MGSEQIRKGNDFRITDTIPVGENRYGYYFGVGLLEGRWVGYAHSSVGVFLLPEISEGPYVGIQDRERAILLTGAVAQDPGSAYGGIDTWQVPKNLRGNPDDFRCPECGTIGCDRDDDRHFDLDSWDEE